MGFHDIMNNFGGGNSRAVGRQGGNMNYNQLPVNGGYNGGGYRKTTDVLFDGKMADVTPENFIASLANAQHLRPADVNFLMEVFDTFFRDQSIRTRDDAFADTIVKLSMSHGLPFMGEGTNRICVGSSDGSIVFKIAHRRLGENLDNRYEVCISKMIADGALPNTDRFALTHISPILGTMVIEQDRINGVRDICVATGARNVGPSGIEYLLNRKGEYINLIHELSEFYFLCDVHIVKPLNFGEDTRGRLKILDYGYVIPFSLIPGSIKLRRGHEVNHEGVFCTCGRKMSYHVPSTNIVAEYLRTDNPNVTEEVYTCTCGSVLNTKEAHQDIVNGVRL